MTQSLEHGRAFSDAELAGRREALRHVLGEAGLDAALLTSYPAIYYLTGVPLHQFGRPAAAVIPTMGDPALIVSVIELDHARAQTPIEEILTYWDYNPRPTYADPRPPSASLLDHIAVVLGGRRLDRGSIGLEDASLAQTMWDALAATFPRARWLPVSELVDRLRLVKSAEELALIRAADAIADIGQQTLLDAIAPGQTAEAVHTASRSAMLQAVLDRHPGMPFHLRVDPGLGDPALGAGHSEWITWGARDVVTRGRVLVTVVDCVLWGYTGNVERTVAVGEPSDAVRRDFETMVEANERAIETVRPGVPLADIDRTCKEVFTRTGHGTRSGSGVGRGAISYEGGWRESAMDVRLYADVVLAPDMSFSIEPDLRTDDATYRHCNTIIVTADGCEVDSAIPRGVLVV
jgi:Xaa-Pro aminopeptidase